MDQDSTKAVRTAVRANRRFLVIAFVFSSFVNILALTGPLFMLQVYDRVLGANSVETLVALSILVAGLFLLMGVLDSARTMLLSRYSVRFQNRLDPLVFSAELRDPLAFAKEAPATNGLRDLQSVRGLYGSPVFLAFFDIFWSPVFFAALFVFHPMIGILGLASGTLLILVAILNQLMTKRRTHEAAQAAEAALSFADRARVSKELILSQGMLGDVTERYRERGNENLNNAVSARDITGTFTAMTKALRLFMQSAMLAVGAYYVIQAEMTAGAMIAGSILLARALQPIEMLLNGWQGIQQGRQAWGRVQDLLARVPWRKVRHGLTQPEAHLSVKGVAVAPPATKSPTIAGIQFDLNPGEALGVIGKSGSGKTSLGRALIGYWPNLTGEIRIGGAALDQYDPDALGKLIGYLPQEVTLLPGTIAENIARMSDVPDAEGIEKAAKRAHAHDMILSLPQGYDTVINDKHVQLSGGQRQRVGLARALYGDPIMLVLDEPNSALDADGTNALNTAVGEFKETGRLVILMTHRPAAIERCDKLLMLENGRQRAFGPREDVLKQVLQKPMPVAS